MKSSYIINYLNEIIPNPVCELSYNKDYELLIAVMLSAQTTDKRVNMVTDILFKKYNNLKDLAMAEITEIIDIIKPLGTFNKKANNIKEICNKLLLECNGVVPNDRNFLESLPGVGRKTTNVVLSMLYNEQLIAVDTHVSRVSKRLKIANKDDNVNTIERKLYDFFSKADKGRLHHQLLLFGRYYCKANNPKCDTCNLKKYCLYNKKNGEN